MEECDSVGRGSGRLGGAKRNCFFGVLGRVSDELNDG
jgi:hypothetical protein